MPLQVVIADDEVLARQKLLQLLREEPDIEVVGEGANAAETIDLVQLTRPDVLLLDIRMPGMDGFDVLSALSGSSPLNLPSIIFTTAHDQYALKAFEVHAVDYLLKPFTRERLRIALDHAREQHVEPRAVQRQQLLRRTGGRAEQDGGDRHVLERTGQRRDHVRIPDERLRAHRLDRGHARRIPRRAPDRVSARDQLAGQQPATTAASDDQAAGQVRPGPWVGRRRPRAVP